VLGSQPALAQSFCSVSTATACTDDTDCAFGEECQIFVNSDITASTTWSPGLPYRLTGIRLVTNGATLTIEPGTVVRSEPNQPTCSVDGDSCATNPDCADLSDPGDVCLRDPGALVVTRGARLIALGTVLKPIVFTDLDDDNLFANSMPDPAGQYAAYTDSVAINGRWGGLILLGRGYVANNTVGPPAGPNPARQLQIEGLQNRGRCTVGFNPCRIDAQCTAGGGDVCDLFAGFYGNCAATAASPGACDDGNSGTIQYVSIRYGGDEVSSANEINGLTMGGVGRQTTIDYVEVLNNQDDAVEIFGGAVNVKHLVLTNAGDDGLDYDEGWRGKGQFVFSVEGIPLSSDPRMGEHDGATGGDAGQPRAIPTIYNATYVGGGGVGAGAAGTSFYDPAEAWNQRSVNTTFIFRDNAGGHYYNSAFLNGGGALALIEGDPTQNETSGERTVTAYALGDGNTFATPIGSAPAGNCDDPLDPNDTATRAIACNDNSDCPVGAGCVRHYEARGDAQFELELEDNTFFCYGNPRVDGLGVAHLPAAAVDAVAAGGENRLHTDIPGLFAAASGLDNSYLNCAQPLPIRELVRISDPLDFPIGDGNAQPVVAIDPRPAAGSPLLVTNRTPPADGFFEPAPYRGAFDGENWATAWTGTARTGVFPFCDGQTGTGPAPDDVLQLGFDTGKVGLRWSETSLPGLMGTQLYDLLRKTGTTSDAASSFATASCVASNTTSTNATDTELPLIGQVFFYLARAGNPCAEGSLGHQSNGTETVGGSCP
jgi:hypothetical protein